MDIVGRKIVVQGRVQGVGFRPYVWRLANDADLNGHVLNDGTGVRIEVWGAATELQAFTENLTRDLPPLAVVNDVTVTALKVTALQSGFRIAESDVGTITTEITPDAATCPDCLYEMRDPRDRRYRYPFINCTHCGPRLSIVRDLPYDRAQTSMSTFEMCADCCREYEDPADRRFHAQPNACPDCGPQVWLENTDGLVECANPIGRTVELLQQGGIVAIKGLGGFHLACDATNAKCVQALRHRKRRPAKPFAVMARDLDHIRVYCKVSKTEEKLLMAPSAPIVLLSRRSEKDLVGVAPQLDRIGVMLPHTPLHHLLMAGLDQPLVMTSGNPSGTPQITQNAQALSDLVGIADVFLMHDRDIVNRLDDSVMRVDCGGPSILRRSRGIAPASIGLHDAFEDVPPTLAMGAAQKAAFCVLAGGHATPSPHIGDLITRETYDDYRTKISLYRDMYHLDPAIIAVDLHPDYLSSRWGKKLAYETQARLVTVQHHHAHLASVLAEHQVAPDAARSVGVILDGTGLGSDGTIWGGEILVGDYSGFDRKAHFQPVALPGGEQAVREPWRNLVAHLYAAFGADWQRRISGMPIAERLGAKPAGLIIQMIDKGVNAPVASSAGRLFDAVAAAVGIAFDAQQYEGQAAMALEAAVDLRALNGGYTVAVDETLSWGALWIGVFDDLKAGADPGLIAARFHVGLADVLVRTTVRIASEADISRVVLSGGVLQNRLLQHLLESELRDLGFDVLSARKMPANDGGLSLGQACVAALPR